jgi:aspartyl protease family protein
LTAASGGHFFTSGQINGNTVQFMVDTGATAVSLGVADATRMGINFKAGQMVGMSTANGVVTAWRVKLGSVRIGDVVVHEVDALVSPASMPYVLLGNSYLSHFQMNRTNDQMVLDKRF